MRYITPLMRQATFFMLMLLLAAMLSAGLVAARAAAPSDDVLAGGNPPLTRGTVNDVASFFEWLFERRFTAGQRAELDRILVAVWRRGDPASLKGIGQVVELQGKAAALTAEQRTAVRTAMLPEMLKNLRAEPVDDFSRLMLAVHDGGSASEAGNVGRAEAAAGEVSPGAAGDASALVGAWRNTQVSNLQYQNRETGVTTPGNGTSMAYKFYPDGRYEYHGYLQVTMYNCTTTTWNPVTGTYRVEGSRLVLTPKTNDWQMRSPCYPSKNMDRQGKMDSQVYTWRTKTENGRENLCLTSAERGSENCFRKE